MKKFILFSVFLFSLVQAKTIDCRVVAVHDGQTFTCLTQQEERIKVNLSLVAAPKLDQPYGQEAKQALSAIILNQEVAVVVDKQNGQDFRGMVYFSISTCEGFILPDYCTRPVGIVNQLMPALGLTWYDNIVEENSFIERAEQDARQARRGLWAQPDPVPPWEWKKTPSDLALERAQKVNDYIKLNNQLMLESIGRSEADEAAVKNGDFKK